MVPEGPTGSKKIDFVLLFPPRKLRVWWRRYVYRSAAANAVRDTLDGDDDDDDDGKKRPGSSASEVAEDPLAARYGNWRKTIRKVSKNI